MNVVQTPARTVVERLAKGHSLPPLLQSAVAVLVENVDQVIVPPWLVVRQDGQLINAKVIVAQVIQTVLPPILALGHGMHAVGQGFQQAGQLVRKG